MECATVYIVFLTEFCIDLFLVGKHAQCVVVSGLLIPRLDGAEFRWRSTRNKDMLGR